MMLGRPTRMRCCGTMTGNQAYANKAIEIMNAWSSTFTEIKF